MNVRKTLVYVLSTVVLLITPIQYFAETDLLSRPDVRKVMERLLEYHVDYNEMSPVVFERSFKVYLKHFDIDNMYFTNEEVVPYLNISEDVLQDIQREYYSDTVVSKYEDLNVDIQQAILRARRWRLEFKAEISEIAKEALSSETDEFLDNKGWADSRKELKKRQRSHLLNFYQSQIEEMNSPNLSKGELENRMFDLYDKRIRSQEESYLFRDLTGNNLEKEETEHLLVLKILKALAKSLDSHTSFFSTEEAYDMRVQLEKGFQGIGVILQERVDGVTITRLIKGGPAEKSGTVLINDKIVSVDGEHVSNYPFKKVLEMIRGEGGSIVTLGLQRLDSESNGQLAQVVNVELVRGKVVLDEKRVDVTHEAFGDGIIGKITLHSFYDGEDNVSSELDVRKAIRDLQMDGELKGIVLDLRENLGGFLMQAVKVAGLFITNGVVVVAKYSDGESKFFRDVDGYSYFDKPLVILTSKSSASAAEIVAQTLQDYGAAIVVGDEHTYGKGSIQHQTVTNKNSWAFFKVTVGRYYTVSGKSTQIEGVAADIVVPTKYYHREMGEKHLDYPLPSDEISPTYDDLLADLDWDSKRWYKKYYMPSLQKKVEIWRSMIPDLRKNSEKRIGDNKNFMHFLKEYGDDAEVASEQGDTDEENSGVEDLQMAEAVNIIKDMIVLEPAYRDRNDNYALKTKEISP
ncbi:MAG: carboxyl-terminal processing protease [Chlamydiales bacterium]|jgi:carboxyl-terminal processing protease